VVATAEDFYDIVERHNDGSITVRTDAGAVVRIGLGEAMGVALNPTGTFEGDKTGFRIAFDTRMADNPRGWGAPSLKITDPNTPIRGSVKLYDIRSGGAIVEVTRPDGTSFGRFMVGDDGLIGVTGLEIGPHIFTLVQPPVGFTLNEFTSVAKSIDANGNPYVIMHVLDDIAGAVNFSVISDTDGEFRGWNLSRSR
jgi:hypothetical protein